MLGTIELDSLEQRQSLRKKGIIFSLIGLPLLLLSNIIGRNFIKQDSEIASVLLILSLVGGFLCSWASLSLLESKGYRYSSLAQMSLLAFGFFCVPIALPIAFFKREKPL